LTKPAQLIIISTTVTNKLELDCKFGLIGAKECCSTPYSFDARQPVCFSSSTQAVGDSTASGTEKA